MAMFEAANAARTPWVLDPVAIGSLTISTETVRELTQLRPTITRGNASEIIALAGTGAGGRGVDSTDSFFTAIESARQLAASFSSVVAISGEVDIIIGPSGAAISVHNGHPLLTRVTGVKAVALILLSDGCAPGAVMAAFASLPDDAQLAATAATGVYTAATAVPRAWQQDRAASAIEFLDELSTITPDVAAALQLGSAVYTLVGVKWASASVSGGRPPMSLDSPAL